MIPERVRVKIMSEGAGYIDTTQVAHREIPFAQLLDLVVAVAGLDVARIAAILKAGSVAAGEYRYRWSAIVASDTEIAPLLDRFPRPDPARAFDVSRCLLARIRAGVETIDLPRDTAAKRRVFQRQNFWDVLMDVAQGIGPVYDTYSYRDGADLYSVAFDRDAETRLRQAAPLLQVQRTAEQVTGLPLDRLILYVKR